MLNFSIYLITFQELNISQEETQESPVLLYLDTITRLLYTLQTQINRGFI